MGRGTVVVLVAACALVAAAALAPAPGDQAGGVAVAQGRSQERRINVRVDCSGGGNHLPRPDHEVRVSQRRQDTVVWEVLPASDADEIEIRPKEGYEWPMSQTPRGSKGNLARGGRARDNAAEGRYSYDIVATCPDGSTMVIDPDIIIDP